MKRNMNNKLAMLSPIIIVIFSRFINRFLLTVILLIVIYLYISICNSCRKHESLQEQMVATGDIFLYNERTVRSC